jgi:AsmA protein
VTVATGIKRLGLAVVAAFAVGTAALGVVSFLVSADAAGSAVKAEIKAVTGFDPHIDGPVTVAFFPTGTVDLGRVRLNGQNQAEPLMTAERMVARLRALPLLAGRIEISDLVIEQPAFSIDIDTDGNTNWSPSLAALARALGDAGSRSGRGPVFSQVQIAKGTMVVRDALHDVVETLTGIDLALAWPAASRGFGATGQFLWRGDTVDTNIVFSDVFAALTGKVSGLKVRLAGAPLKIAFDGDMSSSPSLKVDGALAIEAPSLREAMQWTGNKPLPGGGFGRFTLKAKTNIVGSNVALSAVNLSLDGNIAEGVLSYAAMGRRTWQGTLAVDALDLTPYVSTARLVAANSRDWDRVPILLDGLTGFDLDLRLSAAKVAIGDAKLGRTAIAANLRGGRLALTIGESQAYKGIITGALTLAAAEAGAEFKAQLQLADVDLDSCLSQLFGIRRLEGKGNLSLALEGAGSTVLAMTRTLNGSAKITGNQGAMTGINVEQLLRRLERRPLSGSGDFRTGRTPYDRLTAKLEVTQGMVTVEDVTIEGPTVRLALTGTAAIPSREVDLKGTASLIPAAPQASAFELPFVVQGAWDDPSMLLDAQSLIRRSGATAPLLDALSNRKTRDAVRSAIEKVTGTPPAPAAADAPVPAKPAAGRE